MPDIQRGQRQGRNLANTTKVSSSSRNSTGALLQKTGQWSGTQMGPYRKPKGKRSSLDNDFQPGLKLIYRSWRNLKFFLVNLPHLPTRSIFQSHKLHSMRERQLTSMNLFLSFEERGLHALLTVKTHLILQPHSGTSRYPEMTFCHNCYNSCH